MDKTVFLAVDTLWARGIANTLRHRFGDVAVIFETKERGFRFWRRRVRQLGLMTVFGQLAFVAFSLIKRHFYGREERAFLERAGLDGSPIADAITVSSVNDPAAIALLQELVPTVIVVCQTRILSRRLLESVPAVFINVHTGITPQYRGLHGAYWALANDDPENCGATVHRIDAGVDTGAVIAQVRIKPPTSANYFTYHWYQLTAALPLLIDAVQNALEGKLTTLPPHRELPSRQFYHPTLWAYLSAGLRLGMW